MTALRKLLFAFFIVTAIFLFWPRVVFAQVVINEFQVKPDQWVELYNKGEDSVDISDWIIDDDGGTEKYIISSGIILPSKRCVSFQSGKFNWNTTSGDTVRLLDSNSNLKEEYSYSSVPGGGISIGRVIDGEGDLVVLLSSSRDKLNTTEENCLVPTLTPTPTPTPSPTPTPTSSPTPTPTLPPPTPTKIPTPTSTVTPKTTTPTPTPKQTVTPSLIPKPTSKTATDSGEILGEETATFSAFYPYEATDEAEKNEATPSARNKILPKIFLVGGLLLLFASASWLWYTFKYTS